MVLCKLVRRNYGGKLLVSIKYQNLHSFKEGLILVCQSILETRRITHLHGSAHFTIPLSIFCRDYLGRCSSELAQLVPLPYSWVRSTGYSDRLHDFSATIPRCYKYVYVNSFFCHIARFCNSLPIGCFPLTYDLNGFKSRINRHLLSLCSF